MTNERRLLSQLAKTDDRVKRLYHSFTEELWRIGQSVKDIPEGEFFSFDRYPEKAKSVAEALQVYSRVLTTDFESNIKEAIFTSFEAQNELLGKYTTLDEKATANLRRKAADSFLSSRLKPKHGLGLSQRVWNYMSQAKSEFEAAMSLALEKGIGEGWSAERLGRSVRGYLNNPDMMYRRYHMKKVLSDGRKKDVVEWRRRVVDENGNVHFVKEDLEKVGTGVYRSARQNALRLAATEINMAYRYSDCVRWQNEDFIIGIKISLSDVHDDKDYDMCDELTGDYPKYFLYKGWHPRCRCFATPIMMDDAMYDKMRLMSKAERKKFSAQQQILEMPPSYTDYVSRNWDKIQMACSRGTQPYWIRDNYVEGDIANGLIFEQEGALNVPDVEEVMLAQKMLEDDLNQYMPFIQKNIKEIEQAIKQNRGLSMSYDEADQGKENPKHKEQYIPDPNGRHYDKRYPKVRLSENPDWKPSDRGYSVNCQTCTLIHELRRRGFNVEACSNWQRFVWNVYEKNGVGKKSQGYRIGKWLDADGNPVKPYYAGQWAASKGYTKITKGRVDEFMSEMMHNDGRFEIYVDWSDNNRAHVFMAERVNGVITYFDPQSGKTGVWEEYRKFVKNAKIGIIRVDNKQINPKLAQTFIPLGELPINVKKEETPEEKAARIARVAAKRHDERTEERKKEITDFWQKKKAEGDKRRWKARLDAAAEKRHSERTQDFIDDLKKRAQDRQDEIARITKYIIDTRTELKAAPWLSKEDKSIFDDENHWKRHLTHFEDVALRTRLKISTISYIKPLYDALPKSRFSVLDIKKEEAKDLAIQGDYLKAASYIKKCGTIPMLEAQYNDIESYFTGRNRSPKLKAMLAEAEALIEGFELVDAEQKLQDAKVLRDNLLYTAQKAREAAARKKAAAEKRISSPEEAKSWDDIKEYFGVDMPKTLAELPQAISKYKGTSKTLETQRAEVEGWMRDLFEQCDYGMGIRHSLLDSVIEKGFLNTFQSGTSGGYHGSSKTKGKIEEDHGRLRAAHLMFNPSQHSKIVGRTFKGTQFEREEYEKYGHTLSKDKLFALKEQRVGYGDVQVRFFKDKVCPTWTYNDSLCCMYQPTLCIDPKIESFDNAVSSLSKSDFEDIVKLRDKGGSAYVELQYHGKLDISCVDSMTFLGLPTTLISQDTIDKLVAKGVDLFYKEGDKVVLYAKGIRMTQEEAKGIFETKRTEVEKWLNDSSYTNADVKFDVIRGFIQSSDYISALSEYESLKSKIDTLSVKKASMIDLIPDIEMQHKKFTMAELESAYKAIKDTLNRLTTKCGDNYASWIKKLRFETEYVEHPETFSAGKVRHSTWEISKAAYARKIEDVVGKYRGDSMTKTLEDLRTFSTDEKFVSILNDAERYKNEGRWLDVRRTLTEAKRMKVAMLGSEAKKEPKLKHGACPSIKFSEDDFSKKRKSEALTFISEKDAREAFKKADDYMSKYAERMWSRLTDEEKEVMWMYTNGSRYINEEILGEYRLGAKLSPSGVLRKGKKDINTLTSIINDKCDALEKDMYVQNASPSRAFESIFGVSLLGMTKSRLSSLVGRTGVMPTFMSTCSSFGGDFAEGRVSTGTRNDVIYNIYIPRGTKGAYMEPFASFGDSMYGAEGLKWSGEKRENAPSGQVEFLIQRGAKLRITGADFDTSRRVWIFNAELIEQTAQSVFK